jgi:hypothetical protein
MKSGPDVFADALVPSGRICSRNASFPERQSPGTPPRPKRIVSMAAPPGTWRNNPLNSRASGSAITDPHRGLVLVFGGFERRLVEHDAG